jgi:hypothetical protein
MIPEQDFKQPLLTLLAELFGVSDSSEGFILDRSADGLLSVLGSVSAAQASAAQPGQSSVAAHCGHVLFLLQFFAAFERGETPEADWPGSWQTQTVDEAAWAALQAELRSAYDEVTARIAARDQWPGAGVGAGIMTVAHCAYHVGEVRQRLLWVAS